MTLPCPLLYFAVFNSYFDFDAFSDSPEYQAEENPANLTVTPVRAEIPLPSTPPQSIGSRSPLALLRVMGPKQVPGLLLGKLKWRHKYNWCTGSLPDLEL